MTLCLTQHFRSRGFALALLMWMIAGMSLLVTAVIQLARDDIGLAEQRLREAMSEAVARGATRLILRDAAVAVHLREEAASLHEPWPYGQEYERGGGKGRQNVYSQQYELDGHKVTAAIHPASGFVALGGGSDNELRRLFVAIGGVGESEASALVSGVKAYRDQLNSTSAQMSDFLGFRAREEMLAIPGMSKAVFDRVKDYVQPYEVSELDVSAAPRQLRALFGKLVTDDDETLPAVVGNVHDSSVGSIGDISDGLVTFESVTKYRAASLAANAFAAVLVDIELAIGGRSSYRIWILATDNTIFRVEQNAMRRDVEG
jgi:hypothetical protein